MSLAKRISRLEAARSEAVQAAFDGLVDHLVVTGQDLLEGGPVNPPSPEAHAAFLRAWGRLTPEDQWTLAVHYNNRYGWPEEAGRIAGSG